MLTNKAVKENTQTQKANNVEFSKNKTTLVQSPLTTIGQETRWAFILQCFCPEPTRDAKVVLWRRRI